MTRPTLFPASRSTPVPASVPPCLRRRYLEIVKQVEREKPGAGEAEVQGEAYRRLEEEV